MKRTELHCRLIAQLLMCNRFVARLPYRWFRKCIGQEELLRLSPIKVFPATLALCLSVLVRCTARDSRAAPPKAL